MKSRDEQIKEKIESYINQLRYKLPEKDINYLIEQSPKLFTLKTIDDKKVFETCISDLQKETVNLKVLGVYRSEAYKPKLTSELNSLKNLN